MKIITFLIYILAVFSQEDFGSRLSEAAMALTKQAVTYDPSYYSIPYPMGDIPSDRGVCTDVIIRAYRSMGIDLQKEVHEDMRIHFNLYPGNWGLNKTDTNIDHRRVPNLMKFFERKGCTKTISNEAADYATGDIVCWDLGGGITHIGIVVEKQNRIAKRPLIVHNIGTGQVLADCLFEYKIIGHYSYNRK